MSLDSAQPPGLRLSGVARIGVETLFGPLDFEAPGGRWTCLLGPSGVGKSTILRLIAGLSSGAAFEGVVGADDGAALHGRVALMSQDDLLMPWLSVEGNVALGARLRGEKPDTARIAAILERVGLTARRRHRPHALSGGERQRAALARTLLEDRPVVLLDEPFSALDARTRSQMQELAAEQLDGRTILLVTHDPGEAARLGDVIRILDEQGLDAFPAPAGARPRPLDDPTSLEAQGRLFARLRAAS